jgi:hypothetical protein
VVALGDRGVTLRMRSRYQRMLLMPEQSSPEVPFEKSPG